jgi:hypothetical protein
MKIEHRDPEGDTPSLIAVLVGAPLVLLALWLGSHALQMGTSAHPEMYFGLDVLAGIGAIVCALVGAPALLFGLRHFTRDVKRDQDG